MPANRSLHVLSPEDLAFFDAQGYVVVRQAVPLDVCQEVIDAMEAYLGGWERERWHQPPYSSHGFLPIYQHPALWHARQAPRAWGAIADVLGQDEIWAVVDRVAAKLPNHPTDPDWQDAGFIHWDVDPRRPSDRTHVQSVLSLTDTDAGMGGFRCVPGVHRRLDEVLRDLPDDWRCSANQADRLGEGTPIPTQAGDVIIWSTMLAHGNGANHSDRPRLAQYVKYNRANPDAEARASHRRVFEDRLNGGFPDDPLAFDAHAPSNVNLTPLGRRLVGLDPWPGYA